MKVLIFGGSRFMGRYLVRALLNIGAEVTVANRGTRDPIEGVTNIICDRSRIGSLDQFSNSRFDAVIDFSAYASSWIAEIGPVFANKIARYVFISSAAVYTNSSVFPITEEFPVGPPHPHADYAAEKLNSEKILIQHSENGYFETVSCRLPFVLGPENYEDRESFVFSRLLRGDPILLPFGGSFIHSFIYAGEVAEAILAIIATGSKVDRESFNIAIPEATTSLEFAEMAATVCGKTLETIAFDPDKFGVRADHFDLKNFAFPFPALNSYVISKKLEDFTGFTSKVSLPRILEIYYKWWILLPDLIPRRYLLEQEILRSLGRI